MIENEEIVKFMGYVRKKQQEDEDNNKQDETENKEELDARKKAATDRYKAFIEQLKYKIETSDMSAESKEKALQVLKNLKLDHEDYMISPQVLAEIKEIVQKDTAIKEEKKRQELNEFIVTISAPATAAIVASGLVAAAMHSDMPKAVHSEADKAADNNVVNAAEYDTTMASIVGASSAVINSAVFQNVANKATSQIAAQLGKAPEDITLADIENSEGLLVIQKETAKKMWMVQHPEFVAQIQAENAAMLDRSNQRKQERMAQEQAVKDLTEFFEGNPELVAQIKANNPQMSNMNSGKIAKAIVAQMAREQNMQRKPEYTAEESAVAKKVNAIKQRNGGINTYEIMGQLSEEEAKVYQQVLDKKKAMEAKIAEKSMQQTQESQLLPTDPAELKRIVTIAMLKNQKEQNQQARAEHPNVAENEAVAETDSSNTRDNTTTYRIVQSVNGVQAKGAENEAVTGTDSLSNKQANEKQEVELQQKSALNATTLVPSVDYRVGTRRRLANERE